jgi:hypothetical protein
VDLNRHLWRPLKKSRRKHGAPKRHNQQ